MMMMMMMMMTTMPLTVFTQRNFVADFLQAKCNFRRKTAVLRFWAPSGLRDNVRCSSWAHWKAHSGLPISVNWTFFASCYGWAARSEKRSRIGDFAPTRSVWYKISRRKGSPPPTILLFRKLG